MDKILQSAFTSGYERLSSWAGLLDQINVYPVPDSDTGKNLRISLAPLKQIQPSKQETIRKILISATGNSGNIAATFFSRFIDIDSSGDLSAAAKKGRDNAWRAVADPKHGTMLTVFDTLLETLQKDSSIDKKTVIQLVDSLKQAVLSTTDLLPALKKADVVDAGALGMFIFFEAFFKCLVGEESPFLQVTKIFKSKLKAPAPYDGFHHNGPTYCVETTLHYQGSTEEKMKDLSRYGDSIVVLPEKSHMKIHLHTKDLETLRGKLESIGDIVSWSEENMSAQMKNTTPQQGSPSVHIMTDAAGSMTIDDAQTLGVTLLDSYIVFDDKSVPETLLNPTVLYKLMRDGASVSTAQASLFERYQCYGNALVQYERVVYLCVGSVYSGNFDVATDWKKEHDPEDRLTVIDTGTASGRLGIIALAVATYANENHSYEEVIRFAQKAINGSREFVFLECLKYLVKGGRLSKTSGVFGDLLHMKPIISPEKEGAKKIGTVRTQKAQLKFAFDYLSKCLDNEKPALVMLEYSDNNEWVKSSVLTELKYLYPKIDIMLKPLSLTSGTHMGPGTWGIALIPDLRSPAIKAFQ